MVHRLHEGGVRLADRQTGPAAPHVPAENTHQDCEGKQTLYDINICERKADFSVEMHISKIGLSLTSF